MTRQDFELIASVLRQGNAGNALVQIMAQRLKDTNPAFNKARFIKAATQERAT